MDFIERWFGVSPDGGNGSFELMLAILVLVVLAAPLLIGRLRSTARLKGKANER